MHRHLYPRSQPILQEVTKQLTRRYEAIYIVGPSSSGKTTLCNALLKHIPVSTYITEVARTVMKNHGFSRDDVGTGGKLEMQDAIMNAQLAEQAAALVQKEKLARVGGIRGWSSALLGGKDGWILSDRSAMDPIVYAGWCVPPDQKLEVRRRMIGEKGFQAMLPHYRNSLFVVLSPVKEWVVDDGIRSLEDTALFHKELIQTLEELGVGYREVGYDVLKLEERAELLKAWLGEGETRSNGFDNWFLGLFGAERSVGSSQ